MAIDNLTMLSQHLEDMNTMYSWSEDEWDMIKEGIIQLESRVKDKNLYMGIVGEFSAGKSTFINALLGIDLLKEDILPGTTCAPTFIWFGDHLEVKIHSNKSEGVITYSGTFSFSKRIMRFLRRKIGLHENIKKEFSDSKDFIYKYTADEDFAKNVKRVDIYLPIKNQLFENRIVIVDTPGVNAENHRHQEVTEETIRDYCDLAIVLTPANTPCSRTLISFVHEHLESLQNYCICLASQIDRVHKKERKRQINYIKQRFQTEDIQFLKTYPISAYYAIHDDETNKDESKELSNDFFQTMSLVYDDLKRNRDSVLKHKLQLILEHIINSMLSPLLHKTTNELQTRYEKLQKAQLSEFDPFIHNEKNLIAKEYQNINIASEIDDIVGNAKHYFVKDIFSRISSASSKNELKKNINKIQLQSALWKVQHEYIEPRIIKIQEDLSSLGDSLFKDFKNHFNSKFRNLGQYVNSSKIDIESPALATQTSFNFDAISNSFNLSKSLRNIGVIIGVIIGTFLGCIFFVIAESGSGRVYGLVVGVIIGAIIGAVLGFSGKVVGSGVSGLFGFLFGKRLEAYKNELRDKVMDAADRWELNYKRLLFSKVIQPYYQAVYDNLICAIDKFSEFKPHIERIIQEERKQQEILKGIINQAEEDLSMLQGLLNETDFSLI